MVDLFRYFYRKFGYKKDEDSKNAEFAEELEYLTVPQLQQRLEILEQRRNTLRIGFVHQSLEEQQDRVSRISKINEKIDLLNSTIADRIE